MENPYRRSISELVTRYRLHPEFRDLFVEGERDVSVFEWFLSRIPSCSAAVYHINAVEVTRAMREEIGVSEGGNKGRAIALALILDRELTAECRSVVCLVDKDFHDFEPSIPDCRYLIYTDFACLECYCLSENPVAKLCHVYFNKAITESEFEGLMVILTYIFAVRLAKLRLAPKSRWFEQFTRCCSIREGSIYFDKSAYLARVLNVAAGGLTAEGIDAEVQRFQKVVIADRRQAMHGHDIVQLLGWVARMKGVAHEIADGGPLRRAMLGLLEVADLQKEQLFSRISEWACEGAS